MEREEEDKKEKEVEEIAEKKEELPNKKGKLTEKMRENPWVLSTFVLGIVTLILLIGNFSGGMTGKVVSEGEAGDNLIELAKDQIGDIEILNVEQESGLYKIFYSSEQGEDIVHMTLDGDNIINGLIPISSLVQQETSSQKSTFTDEQNVLIQDFSSCLYDNGMRVYYAGWCGHCHTLIGTFGGLENAGMMMIECQTETQQPGKDADLCKVEEISGFPTIKISGELYEDSRTFEGFSEATGCAVPEVNTVQSSTEEASCG